MTRKSHSLVRLCILISIRLTLEREPLDKMANSRILALSLY
jgi:hypothetical protein